MATLTIKAYFEYKHLKPIQIYVDSTENAFWTIKVNLCKWKVNISAINKCMLAIVHRPCVSCETNILNMM